MLKTIKLLSMSAIILTAAMSADCLREAPQSFTEQNGLLSKEEFEEAREEFTEIETPESGLGVHFNNVSCAACHLPEIEGGLEGGGSALAELRAGHLEGERFLAAPGGSLIHLMATEGPAEALFLDEGENVRDQFVTISLFGNGFIEQVPGDDFHEIAERQAKKTDGRIKGTVRIVEILETGKTGVGRFGWGAQHASLLSFAAEAYLDEQGITSPLFPRDNTFFGEDTEDGKSDPEDDGEDVKAFANFMRALSAPPRSFPKSKDELKDVEEGEKIFERIGCAICHIPEMRTSKDRAIPAPLRNKKIHPYGDFLLHDIGTGSEVVREGQGQELRGKIRTAALWGIGARVRRSVPLLHNARARGIEEAIKAHRGAGDVERKKFDELSQDEVKRLLAFIRSL
jgi:CxxC motif-containing protein (DUF1111 family)